jgi:glutathione S-transferase
MWRRSRSILSIRRPYSLDQPLSTIPILVTEDGVALPGVHHILDYVVLFGSGIGRLADELGDPWISRRRRQYADGIIDAAASPHGDGAAIPDTLDAIEREADDLRHEGAITLAEISLIAALGHLDRRQSLFDWRMAIPT